VGFGIAKTFSNLFARGLMNRIGRQHVLIIGWVAGLPVPFLIIWAPQWEWIIAANILLGVNQGFCWTATLLIMMDIMGDKYQGFPTGLNEFIGYSGVAITALAAGLIAATFSPRPYPFPLGIGLASLGVLMSIFFVRDFRHSLQEEVEHNSYGYQPARF
jgi:MFS family permease